MAQEIEVRFLVFNLPSLTGLVPARIRQGYLQEKNVEIVPGSRNDSIIIREAAGGKKAARFEYPIPSGELAQIFALSSRTIRIRKMDNMAFLTIKGKKVGAVAPEFEYSLPPADLPALFALCGKRVLTKDRYALPGPDGKIWELDIFTGRHDGLVIAELEILDEATPYMRPAWIGPDITADRDLSNSTLAKESMTKIMSRVAVYKTVSPLGGP